jgi:hypothetical protein
VDHVINAHPHLIQGCENYVGHSIYHSLGNFYFNRGLEKKSGNWNQSLVVVAEITDQETHMREFFTVFDENLISVIDLSAEFQNLSQELVDQNYNEKIDKILLEKWDLYYQSYYAFPQLGWRTPGKYMKKLVSKIQRTYFLPFNSVLLQHNLQIETHRYTVERILRKINETY